MAVAMRKIVLSGKTGFINKRPDIPVIIRDKNGVNFYRTDIISQPVKKFNLPGGTWFIDSGSIEKADSPRRYKIFDLPRPERVMENPLNFKILYAPNPSKCTVNWDSRTITFDNSFLEKPLYVRMFVMCHELGHQYYGTEHLADLYARNAMVKMGFNKSQIGLAPNQSLSKFQDRRKAIVVNSLL